MTLCRTGTVGPAANRPWIGPGRSVRSGTVAALTALLLVVAVGPASSQEVSRTSTPWSWPAASGPGASGLADPVGPLPLDDPEPRPAWQFALASAAMPGIGQLARGQERGFAYLLAEALIWTGYVSERNRGRDARVAYRELAWEVARGGSGEPGDGDFEYYERMSRWPRSGAFDADPGVVGIQPETDRATFNGDAWRLAGELFLATGPADPSNPGWTRAIDFYRERAYAEPLTWSWTGAEGQYRRFGTLISESDTRLGRASLLVGGAVLNRLVSGLDALLTRAAGRDTSLRFRISPVTAPFAGAVEPVLELRIVTP